MRIRLWLKCGVELPGFKVETDKSGNQYVNYDGNLHSVEKEWLYDASNVSAITVTLNDVRLFATKICRVDDDTEIVVMHEQHGVASMSCVNANGFHSKICIKTKSFAGIRRAFEMIDTLETFEPPVFSFYEEE